jgi:hypothetical protein
MLQVTNVSVLSGQTTTTSCDTGINQVVAFIMPSAITSTTATLSVSMDGVNFNPLTDKDGVVIELTGISVNEYMILPPEVSYATPRFIRLVLGSAEGADRIIEVVTREI